MVPSLIWNVHPQVSGTPQHVHHIFHSNQAAVSCMPDQHLTIFWESLVQMGFYSNAFFKPCSIDF